MKRILSALLAVVMVVTVLCSFSFAAEAPEEESYEVMGAVTICPECGSTNTQCSSKLIQTNTVHRTCSHYAHGEDTYFIYVYLNTIYCFDCLEKAEIYSYKESFTTCNGYD